MRSAGRSFTEPPGLRYSALAKTWTSGSSSSKSRMRSSGVLPISSRRPSPRRGGTIESWGSEPGIPAIITERPRRAATVAPSTGRPAPAQLAASEAPIRNPALPLRASEKRAMTPLGRRWMGPSSPGSSTKPASPGLVWSAASVYATESRTAASEPVTNRMMGIWRCSSLACGPHGTRHPVQRRPQLGGEVLDLLDTDGEAEQAVADAEGPALGRAQSTVRAEPRVADGGGHIAERWCEPNPGEGSEQGIGSLAPTEVQCQHRPTPPGQEPDRQRLLLGASRPRVVDGGDRGMP